MRTRVGVVLWVSLWALALPAMAEEAVRREVVDGGVHQPVLTKPPVLTHFVEAEYPKEAQGEGRTGDVGLALTIQADGSVTDVQVTQAAGHGFDEAALAAVQRFQFSPAEVDGTPAAIRIAYVYHFVLKAPPAVAAPVLAVLEGRLSARGSRFFVAGATVRCGDDPDAPEATSDADGRFRLEAPPGACAVRVVANGYRVFRTELPLAPGTTTRVGWVLTPVASPYETVVRGEVQAKEVGKQTVSRDEVQTVPGTFGDPLRVIQDLPGVARAPFISGALIVRGASPDETLTLLDGIDIPILYHLGGGPSVVNAAFLDDIQFYPGGFGARYGRAIGGVVDVTTRKGAADTLHGEANINPWDTSVFLESPVGKGVSVAAAARRSYLDATLPLALSALAPNSGLSIVPRYWDYQVRVDVGAKRNTFYVMAFGSDDVLRLVTAGQGFNRNVDLGVETLFHRLKADWTFHDGPTTNVLAPYLGYDKSQLAFGSLGLDGNIDTLGLRDDFTRVLCSWLTLRAGTDLLLQRWDGTATLPVLGNLQYVAFPGAAPAAQPQTLHRVIDGFDGAVYLEADFKLGPVTLTPGLRPSYEREHGRDLGSFDPRLWVRYDVTPRTALKGAVGLYSQPPAVYQLDNPPFGTPSLGPEHAFQTSAGVEHKLSDVVSLDVTGFFNRRYQRVVAPGATVVHADGSVTQNLYQNGGVGKAYGLELLLRHKVTEHFYGWVAYTLSRSVVADPQHPAYHPSSYDETHILTLVGSYRLPWDVEAGLRFRLVTGRPYTPVEHPYDQYAVDANSYSGVTAPVLSGREPTFQQLDVRVEKSFAFTHWTLGVYLDVQNVYNATNEEAVLYDYRYRTSEALPGLPVLPLLGVRGRF